MGTDLNRNFDSHWHESGVSDIPCADTYPGTEPFSEIESQNAKAFFDSISTVPELAVCLHSAAELFLYPYAYARNTFPENVDEVVSLFSFYYCTVKTSLMSLFQAQLGEDAVDALNAVHGEDFICENAAELCKYTQ